MEEIKAAEAAIRAGEESLHAAVAKAFPKGTKVEAKIGRGPVSLIVVGNRGAELDLAKGEGMTGVRRHYSNVTKVS